MMPLGFALIPDANGTRYVCSLNKKISERYPSEFVLHEKGNLLPHVSFFQGIFHESSLDEVYKRSDEIHRKWSAARYIKTRGIDIWAEKIFFLDLDKQALYGMHKDIFYVMNHLRNASKGSADPQNFTGISKEEENSFKTYGFPFALEAFRPHFTLGRSDNPDGKEKDFAKHLQDDMSEGISFNRLVVFNVGKYGSLEGIKKEFAL